MTRGARWADAWARGLLWVALAGVLHHTSSAAWTRLDLTRDQRFTVSAASIDAVRGLERPLHVRVFASRDLAAPYHDHARALGDLLATLSAESGGRLVVSVADPDGDPAARDEAQALGIRPVTYVFRSSERQEARQIYLSAAIVYGERREVTPALTQVARMEYEVVRAIRRVRVPPAERPVVGWLLGDGEPDLRTAAAAHPLGRLRTALEGQVTLRPLALGDDPVPDEVDALLVVAPQLGVAPMTQLWLDQALMAGKPVAYFLSGHQPDGRAQRTRAVRHDLHALIGGYGVEVGRSLLVDRQSNEVMSAPTESGAARVAYPLAIATTAVDPSAPVGRGVRRWVFPFATPLAVVDPLPEGLEASVWIRTMPSAVASPGGRPLAVERAGAVAADEQPGPFPLVVALAGVFPSAFTGQPLPRPSAPGAAPLDPAEWLPRSVPTRALVVSSGDLVVNHPDFVLDAVDWLLDDPALLAVRSRAVAADPLTPPAPAARRRWKLAVVGGPIALLVGLGLWRARRMA